MDEHAYRRLAARKHVQQPPGRARSSDARVPDATRGRAEARGSARAKEDVHKIASLRFAARRTAGSMREAPDPDSLRGAEGD